MPEEDTARPDFEGFNLPVAGGHRFGVLHAPAGSAHGPAIVYVHPFGEEMNKSRRMAALQARALAAAGWSVVQIDLQGCGDSEGDFGDASWERWTADVVDAAAWLRTRCSRTPWLWGLRAGCLLAVEVARRLEDVAGMLFWQPVLSGRQHLQQFLRLRLAADLLARGEEPGSNARGDARESTDKLRERLLAGAPTEVAGYRLSPAVAAGLDAALLTPDASTPASPVIWIEVAGSQDPAITPASSAEAERWRKAGHAVDAGAVIGPSFWQTQEIEECPALVGHTLAALTRLAHGAT